MLVLLQSVPQPPTLQTFNPEPFVGRKVLGQKVVVQSVRNKAYKNVFFIY